MSTDYKQQICVLIALWIVLLPLIWLTILMNVILQGTVEDGPESTNIGQLYCKTATLTLTHNQKEMIGWYAGYIRLGKFNKVAVPCDSLYHFIKAPKLVSAKVLTTSWSFFQSVLVSNKLMAEKEECRKRSAFLPPPGLECEALTGI